MSCDKNKSFQVANLFNELKTDGEKRIARLNLGVKDSDSLTWGNIGGNIYDLEDLIYFVEMLKMLASQTGTVVIFRLNDNTIDRTIQDIPQGWQDSLPDTTPQDELWMTQAVKQGGIYKVGADDIVWGVPIKINYSNVVDAALQEEIDELRSRLNTSIQEQQAINNLVDSMNLVTVNEDGSISVTGRDGQVSVWQHLDLGNYLMLGNIYGNSEDASTSYFLINKTGLLLAHNALIHGTIYATDGWFAGELRAATGSFKGEITATSGKIGGWLIIDGTLKPENVPTTALIGKILASQVDFGSTLTDLRSLILNDYTGKIASLRTSLEQNIELISSRFQVTSNSISSSVLEIRESLESQNLKIRTLQNALNKEKDDRNTLYSLLESKILLTSSLLSLGILETLLNYSKRFNDYVTSEQLSSEISLLSSRISAKVSQIEYNQYQEVIANKFADLSITPEQIQSIVTNKVTEATSSLTLTTNSLQAQITENGNLLSQLGITSNGIMMKGNTLAYYATGNITDPVFACNSDGSGFLSSGAISWNSDGILTLNERVNIGLWKINSIGNLYCGYTINSATFAENTNRQYGIELSNQGIALISYKINNASKAEGYRLDISDGIISSLPMLSNNIYIPGTSIIWTGTGEGNPFELDYVNGAVSLATGKFIVDSNGKLTIGTYAKKIIIDENKIEAFENGVSKGSVLWIDIINNFN